MPASPNTELEAEARQAVRPMRFEPMEVNGKQVEWDLVVTVDFRLRK